MTAENLLRLGIIGAGINSSSFIYPALHDLPVRLAAVCDRDQARAERNARVFGGESVYTDHVKMIKEADLEAVIVCIGPEEHARLAIEVMEAGLPVYTEKPPALTAADARQVLETSRRTGQICMTAFVKRFVPAYQRARAAIESPDFGPPSLLTANWSSGPFILGNKPEDPRTWFLLDFCIHMIDLSRYLFGEVEQVYAHKLDEIAYGMVLHFANGAVGTLGFSGNHAYTVTEKVELTGGSGHFISMPDAGKMMRFRDRDVVDWYETPFAIIDGLVERGYRGELLEFVTAIREGRQPESSIASAYQTMRLYEAIDRSAKERRAVPLSEIE